jgi:hypothetical protein
VSASLPLLLTLPFYHVSLFESINLRLPYPFAALFLIFPTSFLLLFAQFYSFSCILTSFSERMSLIVVLFFGTFTPLRFHNDIYLHVNFQRSTFHISSFCNFTSLFFLHSPNFVS